MRIVAGRHRGRVLVAPPGLTARPTADRARESLFNILIHRQPLADAQVVDAFAGSGALGFEALSRGAAHVTFLESHPESCRAITENAAKLGETGRMTLVRGDATMVPRAKQPCDIVLMDPPYGSGLAGPCLQALERQGWLAEDALIVVEVAAKEEFTPPEGFAVEDERTYGAARLVFLERVI